MENQTHGQIVIHPQILMQETANISLVSFASKLVGEWL